MPPHATPPPAVPPLGTHLLERYAAEASALSNAGIPVAVAHAFLMQQYASELLNEVLGPPPEGLPTVPLVPPMLVPMFDPRLSLPPMHLWPPVPHSQSHDAPTSEFLPPGARPTIPSSLFPTLDPWLVPYSTGDWDGMQCEGPFHKDESGHHLVVEPEVFASGAFRHRKPWRRLRGKRGYTTFHCQSCGWKWRIRVTEGAEANFGYLSVFPILC
eukprot:TRINITY_DN12429_c0_g1_i1.p1 TRINITY_DN12429_c0_g1~~TRINITY_DN12429_c0_g1_i1.p1  ORF type:complete len:214 (+),score=18.96 TRINITY_DN12429_c0_g1_i1:193-834(+)